MRVLAIAASWAAALTCGAPAATPAGSAQLVTVSAAGYGATVASLELWQRRDGCWRRVAGPWRAELGQSGLSTHKREGDGTTPAGTYRLGATVYGIAPDPGIALAYHRLVCGDWWDEDVHSPAYNTFRHVGCGAAPPFRGASEALWRIAPQYRYFAVVDYNAHHPVPGLGSAIFLHVSTGGPTAGCVSLPEGQLVRLLRWLRPRPAPVIHLGIS